MKLQQHDINMINKCSQPSELIEITYIKQEVSYQSQSETNTLKINVPLIYKSVESNNISQEMWCRAIAFNKESDIMIAGCNEKIRVFQFKLGELKQIQLLNEHTNDVCVLNFMKNSNEFISGSWDYSILIWSINNNLQWYCKQSLKEGHTGIVNCVAMNKNEDLIISCSYDNSIKFWVKEDEWKCSQTMIDHAMSVWCISLNDSQNKFVSCDDKEILIYQAVAKNKSWKRIQRIQILETGVRLCFLGDDIITFQPWNDDKMEIFELNNQTRQFIKSNDVKVDRFNDCTCYFPQTFSKSKQILLNKNGQTVYLMRKQNKNDFVIDYSHQFGTEYVFGAMTDDAEYLVTWDFESRQYQVIFKQE